MYVLGVNVADSPSACLITGDGRAIATSELQQSGAPPHTAAGPGARSPRVPVRAIEACLAGLGVTLDDLVVVVVCGERVALDDGPAEPGVAACLREIAWSPRTRIHTIDHHLAHACSAFYPSGFDHAAILVVDRGGSRASAEDDAPRVRASAYRATGGAPERVFAITDRDAGEAAAPLGTTAELLAQVIGSGDVAEVMDLATRGGDRGGDRRDARAVPGPGVVPPPPCPDAAWATGERLQRAARDLAMQVVAETGVRRLCVAGDAAVHGLARIDPRGDPWVDQLYVPPAPDDAGTAVGAAMFGWCEILGAAPPCELETAFRGRSYADAEVLAAMDAYRPKYQVGPPRLDQVLADVADLLAGGALVGWFEGGAELGDPLDRRCVLASPRGVALSSRLGASLGRPSFRAPTAVVLAEEAADYFELSGPSPFAHKVARVVGERTRDLPLVVRGDGTSRVQTIDRWRAPRLHDLLTRFRRRGGVPVLAAAPLRAAGGGAAETPGDALRLWEHAALDAIFLQGRLLVRSLPPPAMGDES
jgi:carbamoyltransferase